MFVTLEVDPKAAAVAVRAVERAAVRFGLRVTRMFEGIDDPSLNPFYSVSVPDVATANRFIAAVRNLPAVEAAYLKPVDSVPSSSTF